MSHSKDELQDGLGRWGKSIPLSDEMHVAVDVSKHPPAFIRLPPRGANEPLPGDSDRRSVKERVKAKHFNCVVPDCGSFAAAVGTLKTDRRHHFRHAKATSDGLRPGHEAESLWHFTAKVKFYLWLEAQLGERIVEKFLDEHHVHTPDRTFEPDIYMVLDSGVRLAVEYQHSPGDLGTMVRKREGYRAAGITDIWLYGPWKPTFRVRQNDHSSLKVTPNEAQINMIQKGWRFYWFDPETETIRTPLNVGRLPIPARPNEKWGEIQPRTEKAYPQRPWKKFDYVHADACALDDCQIDPETGEFCTPVDLLIRRKSQEAKLAIAQLRQTANRRFELVLAARKQAERAALEAGRQKELLAVETTMHATQDLLDGSTETPTTGSAEEPWVQIGHRVEVELAAKQPLSPEVGPSMPASPGDAEQKMRERSTPVLHAITKFFTSFFKRP